MELSHVVLGKSIDDPSCKGAMVFLSGFPDSETSAFQKILPEFTDNYACLSFCMPNYEAEPVPGKFSTWGYSFGELVIMLENVINRRFGAGKKFTLICHDWGCFLGYRYLYSHSDRVERICCFDVALFNTSGFIKISDALRIFCYQTWFATAFFWRQIIPFLPIGEIIFWLFFFVSRHILTFLGPLYPSDRPPRSHKNVHSGFCWIYFRFWTSQLFNSSDVVVRLPTMPFLFMYGTKKNLMFHTDSTLDQIVANGGRYLGLPTGHWVQNEMPAEATKEIKAFMNEKSSNKKK